MKTFYFFLTGILNFTFCFPQAHELDGSWFLHTIQLNNEVYEKSEGMEFFSLTHFSITAEQGNMMAETCNLSGGILGSLHWNEEDQEISFTSFTMIEGTCTETESIAFENALFSFFAPQIDNALSYEIIAESDGSKTLIISDTEGDFVEYTDHLRLPPQEITENDWFLTDLNLDGLTYEIPSNEEIPFIEIQFENSSFDSSICENGMNAFADFNLTDAQLYLFGLGATEIFCTYEPYNEEFRKKYYQFYFSNYPKPFHYEVTTNSDGSKSLQLTGFDGDFAIYNNSLLGINDLNLPQVSLYPNPVKDILVVENPDGKINTVRVIGSNGKTVIIQDVSKKIMEIDFNGLPSGIYFLVFEKNGKPLKTEKVIKK